MLWLRPCREYEEEPPAVSKKRVISEMLKRPASADQDIESVRTAAKKPKTKATVSKTEPVQEVVTASKDDPTAPIEKQPKTAKKQAAERWNKGLHAPMHVDMHKTNCMPNKQAPSEAQIPSTGAQEHAAWDS